MNHRHVVNHRHGPTCSTDPEIGCECGYAEWWSEVGPGSPAPDEDDPCPAGWDPESRTWEAA